MRALWAVYSGPTTVPTDFMNRAPMKFAQLLADTKRKKEHVRVYFDKQAFHSIKRAILSARRSIEIQLFIWITDDTGREIAGMLTDAAERGVRVLIHKDKTGDLFELSEDFISSKNDPDPIWQAFWHHPLITVRHENRHDHSKVIIIDDATLLVSSMNIGNSYCNDWHENLVELHGSHFVNQYRMNGTKPDWPLPKRGCVTVVRSTPEKPMMDIVMRLLESAKRVIEMEMAYFSDPTIAEFLVRKSNEGVFVFIVLPHTTDFHNHANLATAGVMLKNARKNRMFISRYSRSLLHAKLIIVDHRTLFIGSTNLIESSLRKMGETNVLIHRTPRKAIRMARRRFVKDFVRSTELRGDGIVFRTWHRFLSIFKL